MNAKSAYRLACSAFRWIGTYSPDWDYWHRHYPRFDEHRDPHAELQSVSNRVLGAAYRTVEYENERDCPYQTNRYLTRLQAKREKAKTITKYHTKIIAVEYADGTIEKRGRLMSDERMETVAEQRENWKETAKFHLKNEEKYRDAWERTKSELKIERAKVAMLNEVREQMADGIAHLNGLLDWAYDGLDEHWVTLPENVERMKTLAGLFERKHK